MWNREFQWPDPSGSTTTIPHASEQQLLNNRKGKNAVTKPTHITGEVQGVTITEVKSLVFSFSIFNSSPSKEDKVFCYEINSSSESSAVLHHVGDCGQGEISNNWSRFLLLMDFIH